MTATALGRATDPLVRGPSFVLRRLCPSVTRDRAAQRREETFRRHQSPSSGVDLVSRSSSLRRAAAARSARPSD